MSSCLGGRRFLSGFAKKDRPFLFADDEREQYHLYGKGNQEAGVPVVDDVVLTKNLLCAEVDEAYQYPMEPEDEHGVNRDIDDEATFAAAECFRQVDEGDDG